jgi:hypothetical protein
MCVCLSVCVNACMCVFEYKVALKISIICSRKLFNKLSILSLNLSLFLSVFRGSG